MSTVRLNPRLGTVVLFLLIALGAWADGPFSQRTQFFHGSTPLTDRLIWPASFVVDGVPSGDKVCWVRGSQPTVRLKIRYTGSAATYSVSSTGSYASLAGTFPITTTTTQLTCPQGPVDVIFETQLIGLPNVVTKGQLNVEFTFESGAPYFETGVSWLDCRAFLVQSQPTGLMASQNWVEALQDVCLWANGLTEKSDCRHAITGVCIRLTHGTFLRHRTS